MANDNSDNAMFAKPNLPKTCIGFVPYFHRNCTSNKSRNTLGTRPRPYLVVPRSARMVAHDHLGHARALLRGEDGDEAVPLAVEVHAGEHAAPVGLERAAVVVQLDARQPRDEGVGRPRRQAARHQGVLALAPPAGDDVVAFVELGEQHRDVGRIVLQIGVERHDDVAARGVEAGGHRRRLAEVAREADDAQLRAAGGGRAQKLGRLVAAAVVDEQDLDGVAGRFERASTTRRARPESSGIDSSSL